jgi:hypothetical protein
VTPITCPECGSGDVTEIDLCPICAFQLEAEHQLVTLVSEGQLTPDTPWAEAFDLWVGPIVRACWDGQVHPDYMDRFAALLEEMSGGAFADRIFWKHAQKIRVLAIRLRQSAGYHPQFSCEREVA